MKKLTLDQTWDLCLQMWKWIVEEWKKDSKDNKDSENVEDLKYAWLDNHGYNAETIAHQCFFCEYTASHVKKRVLGYDRYCDLCPGRKVDATFDCLRDPVYY